MWMLSSEQPARPGVICMPHKASACQAPVLFSSPRACLFSVQIKYRSFVLVEDRCFFIPSFHAREHALHTQRRYWRPVLMAIHYWKGNRLNMTGVCYGELCSRHLYCRASLSVGTVRSVSSLCLCVVEFLLSVVFFSAAVLITNCLIFELIENSDPVLSSLALQLVSDNICSVCLCLGARY